MPERPRWRRLGAVFCPDGSDPLMRSHASVPFAERLVGDRYRIYFSARDEKQRSRTFALVIDLTRPQQIVDLDTRPILDIGELGCFDDSGAMLTWITPQSGGDSLMYFAGWNLGVTVPFRNALGVARVREGQVVHRFRGPTLDRTLEEPHFVGSACIIREPDRFRCWYLSCVGWDRTDAGPQHRYHIKYAESGDGLTWRRDGHVSIDFQGPEEVAISRPSVLRQGDRYRMWFSYRGAQYRIGYAESDDGVAWRRNPTEVEFAGDPEAWESEARAYPHVFDHDGSLFMVYNGNACGRTGFGLAVLEEP